MGHSSPRWGIKKKANPAPEPPAIHIRVKGVNAKRLRRLSDRTGVSENRLGNMALADGIADVEKRFR